MTSNLIVRAVTDSKEFESLREVWDELLRKSCDKNIYLTWEWLFTWWKHCGESKKLSILLIEDEGRIIGIVPLMQSSYRKGFIKFNVLENISSTDVDYGGVILTERKEESVAALMAYLEKMINSSGITLRMIQIPEDSEFFTLLLKLYPQFSKSLTLDVRLLTTCPYIRLPATWEEYFSSLSSKRRKNLRRYLKLLQKNHSVGFKEYTISDGVRRQMKSFFELHQKEWKGKKLSSRFSHQKIRDFYVDVANTFSQNKWLSLSFLIVDGKVASSVYGFKYAQKFYFVTPAFDVEFSKYSIGNLHILYLIETSIKNRLTEFDFLIGDEYNKLTWTRLAKNNVQIVLTKRRFATSVWLRTFYMIMRLDTICKRSLLENYYLYLDMKREQKRKREIKR